jgi:glutathione peroxidase
MVASVMKIPTILMCLVLASVPAPAESPSRSLNDMDLTSLNGQPLAKDLLDGHVVLFVNVASKCGLTPQYKELQALYESKKEAGLVVVGVPCNQFGAQEPGDADAIASFCELNYGVTFPLLQKQKVNGPGRSGLYSFLIDSDAGGGKDIEWNFEKFVVGRDGSVVKRFAPGVTPDDGSLGSVLDAALAN